MDPADVISLTTRDARSPECSHTDSGTGRAATDSRDTRCGRWRAVRLPMIVLLPRHSASRPCWSHVSTARGRGAVGCARLRWWRRCAQLRVVPSPGTGYPRGYPGFEVFLAAVALVGYSFYEFLAVGLALAA